MRNAECGIEDMREGIIMMTEGATMTEPLDSAFGVPHSAFGAVSCRGVTKEFGDGEAKVWALRGVDLEVPAGRMTLLSGPSGCGKTTLISVVAGLLEPTAGSVAVLGSELTR